MVQLDYRRELLTLRASGIDLGPFVPGSQPLLVAVTLGGDARANLVRAVRTGKALKY